MEYKKAIEEAAEAAKNGGDIVIIKQKLEEAGFTTIYREDEIRSSWRGNSPDGWKDYYCSGDGSNSTRETNICCPKCGQRAIFEQMHEWLHGTVKRLPRELTSANVRDVVIKQISSSLKV